jgi:hypothetical protein
MLTDSPQRGKTQPCAAHGKQICLKVSSKVAAKLDVFEAVDTSGEDCSNSNSTNSNSERLRHFQGNELCIG